jgi:hypothetical protein
MTEGAPKPVRKKKRWLLWLLVVLLLTPFVLLAASYGLLRSPLLQSHIWPRIQPIIAEQSGFQVELEELRVDLLGRLLVRKINITNTQPQTEFCEDLNLSLQHLEVRFNPWALLSNSLVVDKVAVEDLSLAGCLLVKLPETPEPADPPETADPRETLAAITEILNNPPLDIHLKQLQLKNIRSDLEVQIPALAMQAHWAGQLDLDTSLQWTENRLGGHLNTQLQSLAPLTARQQGSESLDLHLTPQLTTHLGWELQRSSPWRLELTPLEMNLQLADLQVDLDSGDLQLSAHWPDYQLQIAKGGHFSLLLDEDWPLDLHLVVSSQLPEGQLQLKAEDLSLETAFHHGLRLEALGQLELLKPELNQLQMEVASGQGLKDLQLLAANQPLSLDALEATFQAGSYGEDLNETAADGDFLLGMQLNIRQLATAPLLKPVNLAPSLQLQVRQDLSSARLSSQFLFEGLSLLDLSLHLDNQPDELQISPSMQLTLPLALQNYLDEAAELQLVGELTLNLEGESDWQHGQDNLLQADWSQLPWGKVSSHLDFSLTQQQAPVEGLQLTGPLSLALDQYSQLDAGQHQVALALHSQGLMHPPLLRPLPLNLNLQLAGDEALMNLSTQGNLRLNQQDFLDWTLALANRPQASHLQGRVELQALPEWQVFIAELAELKAFGPIRLQQDFDLGLEHPWTSPMDMDPEQLDLAQVQFQGDLSTRIEQLNPPAQAELTLPEPLHIQQKLNWSSREATLNSQVQLPEVHLPEDMTLKGLLLNLQARANSGLEPTQAHIDLQFAQEEINLPDQARLEQLALQLGLVVDLLDEQLASDLSLTLDAGLLQAQLPEEEQPLELTELVFPLTLNSRAQADLNAEELKLESLKLTLGDAWLSQELNGQAGFSGQSLLLDGTTLIRLRDDLLTPFTGPMQGSGQLRLPWSISLADSSQLSLQAKAEFADLTLQLPEMGIQGMQGQIRIQEDLQLLEKGRLSFRYLLTPDAFQRVDFNRVEPWLDGRQDFRIRQLQINDLQLGPLEATLPIQQNLIRLQDFSLAALGGEVAGQFYLDVNPEGWRLGLLSRVSRIDLRKLLPETLAETRYSPVNARTALEFDFSQRLVEGRVDLTDINRTQLLQILDIIDPDHRDPQLATARSGLRAAHPRWVRVEMQNGLMDLTLSLSLFKDPIRVRNLPLSPLIERFAEEALMLPDLLPLESTP